MKILCFLFGQAAVLAKSTKTWRQSLLLEILYGSWPLIRDKIMPTFEKYKDTEYLTFLSLLDHNCQFVLSFCSIEFQNNYFENFFHSILRCWVMFMIFKRSRYNKALIILLTSFCHLETTGHLLHHILFNSLNAFDEYPVNVRSIVGSKTKSTSTGEQIFQIAREIDAYKNELNSWFLPNIYHAFSPKTSKI